MEIPNYPFDESIYPSIDKIDDCEFFYPYYVSRSYVAVLGCSSSKWHILFKHLLQMAHILNKEKFYFVWSNDKKAKFFTTDFHREVQYPCRDELNEYNVGMCLPLMETPFNTLNHFCYLSCPIQMYVSPPNPEDPRNDTSEKSRIIPYINATNPSCVSLVSNFHNNVFCHATLQLNMGNKNNAYYVKNVISYCSAHGFKGVVFHCGKKTNKTELQTYENMFDNIINGLSDVRMIHSKFLLETPAGQEGEVLCDIDLFIKFVRKLRKHTDNVEVCVDTCHVFQAGYDPYYYIIKLLKEDIPIGLVHLNDSKCEYNRRVDRHAAPGTGFIPVSFLKDVAILCNQMKIPVVYEC